MAERVESQVLGSGDLFSSSNLLGERSGSGKLIPIGGSAREEELAIVAHEIAYDTGMSILTAPTDVPDDVFREHKNWFRKLGVTGDIFDLGPEVSKVEGQEMLDKSSVVFITGGNQMTGRRVLRSNGMDIALREFNAKGGVVAGTSAGASLISELMPYYFQVVDGLGLMPGVIIDQHFEERHREERLMRAVNRTHKIGVGISEGTGIIYESGRARVFGKGVVHLVTSNGREIGDALFRMDEIIDFSHEYTG